MLFLSRIQHFDCDRPVFLSTALLLWLIATAVLVVEAQETTNGQHLWSVRNQDTADNEWGIEGDVDDRYSQVTSDGRKEEKYESVTGSGFVANALAAGVGTLLANGIANYGSYGSPYTSGSGINNMAGTYVPGAYVPGAYIPGAGTYVAGAGGYIPSAGVYAPASYIPGAGGYLPGSYVPGVGAYVPMANAPSYGVTSTGYRPPQTLAIYGGRDDANAPDASTDLADFANSYPSYYSELVSGNTSPKKDSSEAKVAASVTNDDSVVTGQQDIRTTGSSVTFPIDWSAVARNYYRSMGLESRNRQTTGGESEITATIFADSYPIDFDEM